MPLLLDIANNYHMYEFNTKQCNNKDLSQKTKFQHTKTKLIFFRYIYFKSHFKVNYKTPDKILD